MKRRRLQYLFFTAFAAVAVIYWWQRPPLWFRPIRAERAESEVKFPEEMMMVLGGSFEMGSSDGPAYEGPVHEVRVSSFWMDKTEVTVGQFERFVEASRYVTDAEKFGWSGVFDSKSKQWEKVDGANWRWPSGPKGAAAKEHEPVMQVSWNDAMAYAKWANKRLPTEAEWEYAARGGLKQKKYAWGDELTPGGKYMANFWQGDWPEKDLAADGFSGVAPVGSFPPNGFGLFDMTGNVWEWCADWYSDSYYSVSGKVNPIGPTSGMEKVLRGGSWMCARNFCTNYRVAGRMHATVDSGLNNLGFRCVRDAK